MGVFAEAQGVYAAHNVPTFPVWPDKRPAIKSYLKVSLAGSARLADRFVRADALGIPLRRARLTVLDVDTTDEKVLADALDRYGKTPFVVQTASGGFHAYFRHGGEGCHVRPWPGVPIDVLGDGFVIAPPSQVEKGPYRVIQGGLDDLDNLPPIRNLALNDNLVLNDNIAPAQDTPERIAKGERNKALFRFCMERVRTCGSFDELLEHAKGFALNALSPLPEPIPPDEIRSVAASAWSYEEQGANFVGTGRLVVFRHDEVDRYLDGDATGQDAYVLLSKIRRQHWGREFPLANAMHASMGWSLPRFKKARASSPRRSDPLHPRRGNASERSCTVCVGQQLQVAARRWGKRLRGERGECKFLIGVRNRIAISFPRRCESKARMR
jgi:hypothetical protein